MIHLCETIIDYYDALNTSMKGDKIFITTNLMFQIMKLQPERLNPEDHIVNDNDMICDSLTTTNK